ncbi:MAG: hypothetical protein L6Q95_06595 [Planctomycetes bacterium]|nr:hypothetical protein [Planctomycetota bacterium]
MRWFLALLLLPLLATAAAAHGGSFGHGPPVERGIPCDCGLIECAKCADEALRRGDDVRVSSPIVTEVKRWGDVARCRVAVELEAVTDRGMFEAYARVEPGPVFACLAGSLRNGEESLSGELRPGAEARGRYLYARRLFNFDPMLVLRRAPGRVDLRVYPLKKGTKATAVLEGYVLVDRPGSFHARLYRTGDRVLAVVPLATDARRREAALADERSGRSLHFLTAEQCRARFLGQTVEDVPFVPALESAITGRGGRAASSETALVAIAAASPAPPFIGPDRVREGRSYPGDVPPGLREPSDPELPPPPPEDPGSAPTTVGAG